MLKVDTIYNMDCLLGLRSLPDNVIDLTVTSPPYDKLRSYNGKLSWSEDFFNSFVLELYRVTKQGGVVVWIVGDMTVKGSETGTSFRQALGFMDCGFRLHDTMIYYKGAVYPEVNRYYPAFEYMFVLSNGKPKTANLIADRPNKCYGEYITGNERQPDGKLVPRSAKRKGIRRPVKAFGVRFNVWEVQVGYMKSTKDKFAFEHPAVFPEQLARDHIITWSNPGDLVLDPFIGSGTTAKMAYLSGRHYLGYEIDAEYYGIALQRMVSCVNGNGKK